MELLIIRHAHAGSHEEFAKTGQPGELRPLTKTGVHDMKEIARGLRRIVPTESMVGTIRRNPRAISFMSCTPVFVSGRSSPGCPVLANSSCEPAWAWRIMRSSMVHYLARASKGLCPRARIVRRHFAAIFARGAIRG